MCGSLKEWIIPEHNGGLGKLGERQAWLQVFEKRWGILISCLSKPSRRRVLFRAPLSGYYHVLSVSLNQQYY